MLYRDVSRRPQGQVQQREQLFVQYLHNTTSCNIRGCWSWWFWVCFQFCVWAMSLRGDLKMKSHPTLWVGSFSFPWRCQKREVKKFLVEINSGNTTCWWFIVLHCLSLTDKSPCCHYLSANKMTHTDIKHGLTHALDYFVFAFIWPWCVVQQDLLRAYRFICYYTHLCSHRVPPLNDDKRGPRGSWVSCACASVYSHIHGATKPSVSAVTHI